MNIFRFKYKLKREDKKIVFTFRLWYRIYLSFLLYGMILQYKFNEIIRRGF